MPSLQGVSLAGTFAEYHRTRLGHLAAGQHMAGVLERDLVRLLGPRPLASIGRRDLVLVLDEVEGRGSPVAPDPLLQ